MFKDTKNTLDKQKSSKKKMTLPKHLEHINKMAAGIDIGSNSTRSHINTGIFSQF
jgi:hypothetical protein